MKSAISTTGVSTGGDISSEKTVASDFGKNAATSLCIEGINISELTSGIPGMDVQDFTGLSGGPAFLPVNPRQDPLSGRQQCFLDHEWAFVEVRPALHPPAEFALHQYLASWHPNFQQRLNNPANNTGGSGMATLLTGYLTAGTRGALFEPDYQSNNEWGFFLQDDWKISKRLTLNMGVRYEIYTPDIEIRDRLVNVDRVGLKLVYAGEDGTTRAVNKSTQYGNIGPRFGFAYDLFGQWQDHPAGRIRFELLPRTRHSKRSARHSGSVPLLTELYLRDQSYRLLAGGSDPTAFPGNSNRKATNYGRVQRRQPFGTGARLRQSDRLRTALEPQYRA